MLNITPVARQRAHRKLIDEYWDNQSAVSQSVLKSEILRVKSVKSEADQDAEEKNAVQMGSLLDCMLFTPDLVEEIYHVGKSTTKPSGKLAGIVRKVVETVVLVTPDDDDEELEVMEMAHYEEHFVAALDEAQYYTERKRESRLKDVYKLTDYYDDLCAVATKRLISQAEYKSAILAKTSIEMSDVWDELNGVPEGSNVEVFVQQPVYAYIDGVLCKGLLDYVRVDHDVKVVTYVDLKRTTRTEGSFPYHARDLRYDFQLAFYGRLLHEAIKLETPIGTIDIEGYTVKCGGLLTCFADSKGETQAIKLLNIDNEDLIIGRFGRKWTRVYVIRGEEKEVEFVDLGYEQALTRYVDGDRRDNQPFRIWS